MRDNKKMNVRPKGMTDREWKMCANKKRYPTEKCAIGVALKRSKDAGALLWYKCPYCHGYHLTSHLRD
jgi:hypothetical protein